MLGYINKLDSFATLDGGGIRYCVFMQGCPLACVYCHNADSKCFFHALREDRRDKTICLDSAELAEKIIRNKGYYKKGGVTFSGGEPLSQAEFILETIKILKKENLHVAIDTSGVILNDTARALISEVDLLIVDLKFTNNADYKKYCGVDGIFDKVVRFINLCGDAGKRVIIRTVVIPGINDTVEQLQAYKAVVDGFGSFCAYELLPFHTLGFSKYSDIGEKNPLDGVPPMDLNDFDILKEKLFAK